MVPMGPRAACPMVVRGIRRATTGGAARPMSTRELLMEPITAAGHDDLHGLRLDLLRQAAAALPRPGLPGRRGSGGRPAPSGLASRLPGGRNIGRSPVRAGRQGPGSADADLRTAAGEPPLSAHEAPDPAMAQRGRLHAVGQHARPGRGGQPQRGGRPGVPGPPGREPGSQGDDRASVGRGRTPHLPALPPRLHREPQGGLRLPTPRPDGRIPRRESRPHRCRHEPQPVPDRGSRNENVEPWPAALATSTRPPCSSTKAFTSQRPRPIPRLPNW